MACSSNFVISDSIAHNGNPTRAADIQSVGCGNSCYTGAMSRSAFVQARVLPEIKFAAERVLRGLGLTMTDLMELVLRRLIVDQKLPFEAVALNDATLAAIANEWRMQTFNTKMPRDKRPKNSSRRPGAGRGGKRSY